METIPLGTPVATTTMGDRLVRARIDALDPSAPTILVEVRDENGVLAATSLNPPNGHFADSELAVLGSPEGDAFLLAWTDAPPDGSTPSRLNVVRYSCAP